MDSFLIDVPVPSMGATVSELTVIDIKVQNGARVAKGDKIAELESQLHALEMQRENMNNKIEDMAARLHTYSKVGRI